MRSKLAFLLLCCAAPVQGAIVEYHFAGTVDTFLNGAWFVEQQPFPFPTTTFVGRFAYDTDTPYASLGHDLQTLPATGVGVWRYPQVAAPIVFSSTVDGIGHATYSALGALDYTFRSDVNNHDSLVIRSTSIRTDGVSPRPQWMALRLIDVGGSLWQDSGLPAELPALSADTYGEFYLGSGNSDPYLSGRLSWFSTVPEPPAIVLAVAATLAAVLIGKRRRPAR